MKLTICCGAVLSLIGAAVAEEARFTTAPRARRSGEHVVITFTVSKRTDVEVAILDGKGRVVRHLAAGVLGPDAPEPFERNALAQKLVWDGRGDYGLPVEAASVRVRLGLRAGRAKALDVRPAAWKRVKREPPKNGPAPRFEAGRPHELYKATFGSTRSYTTGTYLARGAARLFGDPDTGLFYYWNLEHKQQWEHWYRLHPETGEATHVDKLPYATGSLAFGSDGLIYLFAWGWAAYRVDRQWKPAPFPGTGLPGMRAPKRNGAEIDASGYGDGMGPRAFCLGLDGKVYGFVSHPQSGYARVHVWGRDGKLEKSGFVPFARIRHASNIRVDRQGFLYVALNGLPEGHKPTPPLEPADKRSFVGTIVKLRIASRWAHERDPEAGTIPSDPAKRAAGLVLDSARISWRAPHGWGATMGWGPTTLLPPAKVFVADVARAIPGVSWVIPSPGCSCSGLQMDMDRFGRLYVPDPARARVRILDAAGNDLAAVVQKSKELAIAWPIWVACAGDAIAFYDGVNRRAVHVKIEFAVAETVALPGEGRNP
jgi:hypothetical protein